MGAIHRAMRFADTELRSNQTDEARWVCDLIGDVRKHEVAIDQEIIGDRPDYARPLHPLSATCWAHVERSTPVPVALRPPTKAPIGRLPICANRAVVFLSSVLWSKRSKLLCKAGVSAL